LTILYHGTVRLVSDVNVRRLYAVMGGFRYAKLITYFLRKSGGEMHRLQLICEVLNRCLGYIPLPLCRTVNREFRRVRSAVRNMTARGYLRLEREREVESPLIAFLAHAHRSIKRKGVLPMESWRGYRFKLMSFEEMADQSLLPVFLVSDHLMFPCSRSRLVEATGYAYKTVDNVVAGLRFMGLIERVKQGVFVLKQDRDRVLRLLEAGDRCKRRRVNAIQKYIQVCELMSKGVTIGTYKTAKALGVPPNTVYSWVHGLTKPKVRRKTAELLAAQGYVAQEELKVWSERGVLA